MGAVRGTVLPSLTVRAAPLVEFSTTAATGVIGRRWSSGGCPVDLNGGQSHCPGSRKGERPVRGVPLPRDSGLRGAHDQGMNTIAQPHGLWRSEPGPWLQLSTVAAILAATGSVIGLLAYQRVYGDAYPSLTQQALAQDLVNLAVVVPLLIGAGLATRRGRNRAWPVWLGTLMFTVYNYVIYTFAIHFGWLFPLWVAVLGLATYALCGGAVVLDATVVRSSVRGGPIRTTAWFLIVMGAAFAVLWLADIVGALRAGRAPTSVADLGVPTNPVHVLDLALFLPAAVATGVLLLRNRPLGFVAAPTLLLFLVLTGLPILVTPMVAVVLGQTASWAVTVPIAVITVGGLALLRAYLRALPGTSVDMGQ
jgi:hypothetical protein